MLAQIFGVKKSADTRKALRFFSERRIQIQFVDFKVRPASRGELKRFAQKFGIEALVDRDSKRFHALGLAHARYSEDRWLEKLADEPMLLCAPLVRWGKHLSIGLAESDWRTWVETEP